MDNTPIIAKEAIKGLTFPQEAINDANQRQELASQAERAMVLGNSEHGKVSVLFHSAQGKHKVETTIWVANEQDITLKGGVIIPLKAIESINW